MKPPQIAPEDHNRDRDEVSHSQLLLESPSMAAILSSIRAVVWEEVRVALSGTCSISCTLQHWGVERHVAGSGFPCLVCSAYHPPALGVERNIARSGLPCLVHIAYYLPALGDEEVHSLGHFAYIFPALDGGVAI